MYNPQVLIVPLDLDLEEVPTPLTLALCTLDLGARGEYHYCVPFASVRVTCKKCESKFLPKNNVFTHSSGRHLNSLTGPIGMVF